MSANPLDPASSAPQTVKQARTAVLDAVGAYAAAACAATVISRGQADVMWHALRGALDALILAVERRVREEAQQEIARLELKANAMLELSKIYEQRAEAAEAEVTRLKEETRQEVEKAVKAERMELFCRAHAKHWENTGVCPICESESLSSRLAQQEKN